MNDDKDVLHQLAAFRWREVEIPISKMRMSIAHDLVEHKYWGVDGARMEATGMAPTRIHATLTFQTGIVPGDRESWDPNKIYPTLMRALVLSFGKRESGLLQHPEFGNMICKAEKLDIDWDAMKRGGCDGEASWVETTDDRFQPGTQASPVNDLTSAARGFDDLDTDAFTLVDSQLAAQGLPQRWPHFNDDSFEGLVGKVTGFIDQAALIVGYPKRMLDRVVSRAEKIQSAVDRARTALVWPIRQDAEKMIGAANNVREQVAAANRELGFYRVPVDTTLAALVVQIPGSTSNATDLIRLNPDLLRTPEVIANSVVRYFGKGAPLARPYRRLAQPDVVGRRLAAPTIKP